MKIDNNKAVAVIGDPSSGKTNLAFYLASQCTHKKKYTLGYPKKIDGFTQLSSVDDLAKITDCVLVIDEFSKYFPVWEKKSNEKLLELLQFAEHNRIKLILATQLSQFITKQCEAFIPQWAIKQVNVRRLKNGSTPSYVLKYIIKDRRVTKDFIKVKVDEFIWYNEQSEAGENGFHTFPDMSIGKDWNNADNAEQNTDTNTEENVIVHDIVVTSDELNEKELIAQRSNDVTSKGDNLNEKEIIAHFGSQERFNRMAEMYRVMTKARGVLR